MPVSLTNLSTILAQVSKYLIIILMMIYTVQCYTVFRYRTKQSQSYVFTRQNVSMFIIHFVAYLICGFLCHSAGVSAPGAAFADAFISEIVPASG